MTAPVLTPAPHRAYDAAGAVCGSVLAYIDPGSLSFLLQILIAAIIGAGVALKSVRTAVVNFFALLFGRRTKTQAGQAPASLEGTDGPGSASQDENPVKPQVGSAPADEARDG